MTLTANYSADLCWQWGCMLFWIPSESRKVKWYDWLELRLGKPEDGWVLFFPNIVLKYSSSVAPIKTHPTQNSYTSYKFSMGIVTLPAIFYLLIFMPHSSRGILQTSNILVCFRTCFLGNSDKDKEKAKFNYPEVWYFFSKVISELCSDSLKKTGHSVSASPHSY